MDLGSLLWALPTVFIAAFLAVLLENARERFRTRKWVIRNLREMAASLTDIAVDRMDEKVAALEQWLAADTPELDEAVWQRAHMLVASAAPELSPLLRSDAATSVSVKVFQSVYRLESVAAELTLVEGLLHESFVRDVLPLWYERRAPLQGADARRVRAFRDILLEYQRQLAKVRAVLQEFQQAVARL
ncbi:hypothetical protein JQS43_02340 [Natronosporangium hydrolyticum]|uniref:Uncharacterized protein n=1 Tax=Natronosporangium hydrolyticum TaxID=2811111 RepID=A0A895YKP8_9ACTN|nr:hypothetical protein [Natronosporangium hydrolyticum]QSB15226.1 hypothetical protein JQS43_02340 [Natronosporangium hydrolyticum]